MTPEEVSALTARLRDDALATPVRFPIKRTAVLAADALDSLLAEKQALEQIKARAEGLLDGFGPTTGRYLAARYILEGEIEVETDG